MRCLLFGAGGDRDSGREIESSLPADVRAVNLIGRTDLGQLAGAISRCSAFVSNDSGRDAPGGRARGPGRRDLRSDRRTGDFAPLAVVRRGELVTPDVLTHPVFCRPCMLRDCPIDHRCMKGVTVDAVVAAVNRRLEAGDPASAGAAKAVTTNQGAVQVAR